MEKPPVISDEELRTRAIVYFRVVKDITIKVIDIDLGFMKQELQAQRDADVEWYEKEEKELVDSFTQTMREIFEEIEKEFDQFAHTSMIQSGYADKVEEWNEYFRKWQSLKSKFLKPKEEDAKAEQPDG